MTAAKFVPLLLIFASLLAASCGPPPENASRESSQDRPRERASATSPPAEPTGEETAPAPEKTAENAAKERAAKGRSAAEKPGRKETGKVGEVEIRALKYLPGPVTVPPGTTVRWVNEDRALHTVTSEGSGGPLQSEELERGDSYEHMFREPGQYDYYCVVHPFMKSGVTVE